MATVKIPKVKVGQICWTCGGYDILSFRLVKVVEIRDKPRKGQTSSVFVKPVNPSEVDKIWLGNDLIMGIHNPDWLFTEPSDWRNGFEGSPESVMQPVVEKKPTNCPSCNSKITAKMKFCGECGEKL